MVSDPSGWLLLTGGRFSMVVVKTGLTVYNLGLNQFDYIKQTITLTMIT
jgi:hypothetical protein